MKYIVQVSIIFVVTFLGEVLHWFIPLPIPASIYGLVLMFFALQFKIIKLEQVKAVSNYLLEIMPIFFLPASVGLMSIWRNLSDSVVPLVIIILLTTILVMFATGKTTDFIIKKSEVKANERDNQRADN